jgi:hypothetical protein
MRTGIKLASFVMVGVVCLGGLSVANASSRNQHKAKAKKVTLPPLPSGPLGPVPQLPLDSTPAVAPQVSYQSGQLTILAPNSNLGDILRAVRKQTGAEMEIPANANERVVTQLGPGPAREVIAELLNGSRFNYVLLGSPADSNALTRIVLVAKTGGDVPGQNPQQASDQTGIVAEPQPDMANAQPEPQEGEAPEENAAEDNPDQNAAEAEQPAPPPDQPGVKTPQQMLQEMQQRQLQLQQQQPQGQPPIPGAGYPPPPQRPPEQQ